MTKGSLTSGPQTQLLANKLLKAFSDEPPPSAVAGQFYLFIFFKYLFIYYVHNILSVCLSAGQKRASDISSDGCEPPCGCWELNSGPMEEQAMLLTSEPSLQPPQIKLLHIS